ncbi:MAG TPA: hypothetical protein DEG17_04010 [Cyanobacteria bacterium UBA11149]|nr:hypothetical protein [Cyanobacteria bacterium UBA11367]HBE57618.1 hypothetical protein [Cyanobacteria bacterium UBA11366]HBK63335.1 hypothetical protein [Cyanobacteria bacterium UBA11166]HBR73161.1 hypothetical protein [Cyanobacteria bacterium UBA11159]HBS69565.1 hypothetical protein [Cyanobacteria bacterium UBA11153]HBW88057.1 hypothetical protein [Cyanobacteria bacterium UBA11149]HCA96694.1 hypothetical protein [Cyanobacteria bacterium UBA9226]
MVILEKTPTQLKLRHRPYFLWIATGSWLFGIFVLILLITLQSWLFYLWWIPVFLILNILIAISLLLFTRQIIICHFDKVNSLFILKRQGLLTKKIIWHPLGDILDVQLKSTSWNRDQNSHQEIAIILKSGKDLILDVGQGRKIDNKLETVNLIRKFLEMPTQTLNQPSVIKFELYDRKNEN